MGSTRKLDVLNVETQQGESMTMKGAITRLARKLACATSTFPFALTSMHVRVCLCVRVLVCACVCVSEFAAYFSAAEKTSLKNVISLEFSRSRLDRRVQSPAVVRAIDLIDHAWPQERKAAQRNQTNAITTMKYPKVGSCECARPLCLCVGVCLCVLQCLRARLYVLCVFAYFLSFSVCVCVLCVNRCGTDLPAGDCCRYKNIVS